MLRFIDNLPPDQKRRLWEGIKRKAPALARLMTIDPVFSELKAKFQGRVLLSDEEITNFINE